MAKLWMTAAVLLGSAAIAEAAPCSDADAYAIAGKLRVTWKSAANQPSSTSPSSKADPSGAGGARLDGPNNAYIELACVGGNFGGKQPAYYIEAIDNRHQGDNRIRKRHRLVVTKDGGVVASVPEADDMERQLDHSWSYRTLDLDGDGIDEVLATDAFEHNALARSTTVVVRAIRGGKIEDIGRVGIDSGGASWPTCTGKLAEEKAGKATHLVMVAGKAPPPTDKGECPSEGRHVFAIVGGKLVEVDAAGKPTKKP